MNIIIFPGRPNRSEIETKTLIKTWDSFAIIISLLFFTTAMIRSSVVVDYKKLLWPAFPPDVYFFFFCSSCMMSLRRWSAISSKNSLSFLKYCRTTLKLFSLPEIVNTNFVLNNAGVIFKWTYYEKTLGIATVFRFSPLITTSILDRPRDLSLIAFHENQLYLSCIGDIRLLWKYLLSRK